jgi:hypothetical protein
MPGGARRPALAGQSGIAWAGGVAGGRNDEGAVTWPVNLALEASFRPGLSVRQLMRGDCGVHCLD